MTSPDTLHPPASPVGRGRPNGWHFSDGFTLVEIMIGVAIFGFVAILLATVSTAVSQALKSQERRMNVEQAKFLLRNQVSCLDTREVLPDPCPAGTPTQLMNRNGIMVSTLGSQIGGVQVRASCTATGGLVVEQRPEKAVDPEPWGIMFEPGVLCP